jgi:hypothetical protein
MTVSRFRLGVDFGTSTTIAMVRRPDGRVGPLLFDGSPLLSSAVLLGPDGRLHTGRDAAHLARTESSKPIVTRNLTTTIGMDICTITRSHTEGAAVIGVSLSFSAYVFNDVSLATTYQKTALDNARLNTTVTDVADLGEEAFAYEHNQSADAQKTTLALTITVRDSNLQWTTALTAIRSDAAGWTRGEKRDLQSKLAAATRSSLTRTVPVLAR